MSEFSDWLNKKMLEYNMSQADLSRASGISRQAINNVITERQGPGADFCIGVAKAFSLSPIYTLQLAGKLPKTINDDREKINTIYELSKLVDDEKADLVIAILRKMIDR